MFNGIKDILFFDMETYYHAQTYTLRNMTIPEYILDPRYETIICSVALDGEAPHIIEGPDFGGYLSKLNPETTATVAFNALFDNSILALHYGWVPKLMLDSMNMARALRGHLLPRNNLESVCALLGLPHDKSAIIKASGKRLTDIKADPVFMAEFSAYCNRDNARSRDIFKLLIKEFPLSERRIMDLVIRAAVQPRFMLDRGVLQTHLDAVRAEKERLLLNAGTDKKRLLSGPKFQQMLEGLSVTIEYKTSPATGKPTPAFAKSDQFMIGLQDHWDTRVQALACARLGIKSTLEETRTEKFLKIASLAWDHYRDGNPRIYSGGEMPVPLRYAGAHTHRLSGDWRLNMQNMPRKSKLRKALIAPAGHVVIAGDLAQIEARLVAWLAGCTELLREFAAPGGDPYSAFASVIFGFPVDRKYVDPVTGLKPYAIHGFIGKTGVLGLGYQCGDEKFFGMVATLARLQGLKLEDVVPWSRELAITTVRGYRERYHQIPALWGQLQNATHVIWSQPGDQVLKIGPVTIKYGEIEGPNGLKMLYGNIRNMGDGWLYTYGWDTYKMYGGKMLENIIQFLARIIIMNAALRLDDLGYRFVLQAHDELVFIVPKSDEQNAKAIIHKELTRPPSWGRDIPLGAEVMSGPSYGDCK